MTPGNVLKSAAGLVSAALVALAATPAAADDRTPASLHQREGALAGRVEKQEGQGVVRYDPGEPADTLFRSPIPRGVVGNRFDTRNGRPLSPGSISQVTWYHGTAVPTRGLAEFFGPADGTTAPYLLGIFASTIVPSAFNFLAFTPQNVGSSFLAGMYVPTGNSFGTFGSIGLRSATTDNQGYHGIQIGWFFGTGYSYRTLPGQNAMFRVSGTVVVPVELQEFELD